jgi:hypothetical protein
MKTIDKVSSDAQRIAAEAFARYSRDLHNPLYLYAGNSEVALCGENEFVPKGMELATGQHVPRNMELTQLSGWVYGVLCHTPYLT